MLKNSVQMSVFLFGAFLFGITTVNAQELVRTGEGAAITTQKSPSISATDTEKVREVILVAMAVTTASSQPFYLSGGFALVPYTAFQEVMPTTLPTGCL